MFGKYAAFIIPSYAVSALVIAGLIVWIMLVYRSRRNEIAELERLGIARSVKTVTANTARAKPGKKK
jgi:heme exporter protein D